MRNNKKLNKTPKNIQKNGKANQHSNKKKTQQSIQRKKNSQF